MSFGEGIVKRERLHRRRFCFRASFAAGQSEIAAISDSVGVRHTGVSKGVLRIFLDGPLKIGEALFHAFGVSPIPVVASAEIELISLHVLGIALCQLLLLCASQLDLEVIRDSL